MLTTPERSPHSARQTVALGAAVILWLVTGCKERGGQAAARDVASTGAQTAETGGDAALRGAAPEAAAHAGTSRWARLLGEPASIENDAELAMVLEDMANAEPAAVAAFLQSLVSASRSRVIDALLMDLAGWPEKAVQFTRDLIRADPEREREYGYALVSAFTRRGEYDFAIRFAREQDAATGESENPAKWINAVFTTWAAQQPAEAAAYAVALPPGSTRAEALRTISVAWAAVDPASALTTLLALPTGEDSGGAVRVALRAWVERDAESAAKWLAQAQPNLDLDSGMIALAQRARAGPDPEQALAWAERILDAEARSRTAADAIRHLGQQDVAKAREYVDRPGLLSADDRVSVLSALNPPPQ